MKMINKANFYAKVKEVNPGKLHPLFTKIQQSQLDGMEAIFDQCEKQSVTDNRQIAYILATIYHEVNTTMQPIEEYGKGHNRTYGHRVWYSGKTYTDVPFIYYGRGLTQNTWRDTYVKLTVAAKKQGYEWDFENNPELLLQMLPSAWASVYAMKVGLYTGAKLSWYFNDEKSDPVMARSIVNGKRKGEKLPDKAELIAGYYEKFLYALD